MLGDIINGKYAKLLLALRNKKLKRTDLAKMIDIHLSALSVQLSRFAIQDLIQTKKDGRELTMSLTEYGESQAELISQILVNIEANKNQEIAREEPKEEDDTEQTETS